MADPLQELGPGRYSLTVIDSCAELEAGLADLVAFWNEPSQSAACRKPVIVSSNMRPSDGWLSRSCSIFVRRLGINGNDR